MPNLAEWQTRQLRVTAFNRAPLTSDNRPSMEAVFGVEAEATVVEGPNKDFTALGSLGVGKITLKVQHGRVDWLWEVELGEGEIPNLGGVAETLDIFLMPIAAWIRAFAVPIGRVALGGIWGVPVPNREDGYKKLQEYLPDLKIDGANSSEFLYQINRWASHEIAGRAERLNRIRKWSVQAHTQGALQISLTGGEVNVGELIRLHDTACELDLSSPANLLGMTNDSAADLLGVLRGYALPILEEGDHA